MEYSGAYLVAVAPSAVRIVVLCQRAPRTVLLVISYNALVVLLAIGFERELALAAKVASTM